MEKNGSRKWRIFLPTAALLTAVAILGLCYPKYFTETTWSHEELSTGARPTVNIEGGHGPVAHPATEPNDVTVRLHPEQHIRRKPRTIELDWNITKETRRPDGVAKQLYLINGQFPGPAVELRSGDRLLVAVHNQLEGDEGVAIHWHGLRIASEMDGVVGLTQCAIKPNRTFTYQLHIPDNQAGTFWYHSHSEIQRADGLFGPLVVHRPMTSSGVASEAEEYGYAAEQVLMVGDWYHQSAQEVLRSYTDWKDFRIEPSPDSMLLNGMGYFDCSMATNAQPVDCERGKMPHLKLPDRTRLRIINTGALTGFTLSMTGYTMRLVQVDGGHPVEPVVSEKVGILYPGERIDVIFERAHTQEYASAWITITLDRENMRFPNLALTEKQQFPVSPALDFEHVSPRGPADLEGRQAEVGWIDLSKVKSSPSRSAYLATNADEAYLVHATIRYLTQHGYRPKGFINHTSWMPSNSTSSPLLTLERAEWPEDPAAVIPTVRRDGWAEIVINNLDENGHAFHLHGHDFFVLSTHRPTRVDAREHYNPFESDASPAGGPMNLESPLRKDTVYIPRMGYAVLRFRADNAGLWLFHCHVLWHEAVGMNMAFQVQESAAG